MFLFIFFPVTLFFYFIVKNDKVKNIVLVIASLIFYSWGEPVWVCLLIFSSILDYTVSLGIEKYRGKKITKLFIALSVVINLGLLAAFKYSGFFVSTLNGIFRLSLHVPTFSLPIGISFYTFQTMSYSLDVYKGDVKAQKSFINFLMFVSLFPQLIAGPIVKYHDIEEQIENRTVTLEGFSYGVKRFIFGLGKKVILANTFAEVVDAVYAYQAADVSQAMLWLTALLYMLQIYFDFSGYSDMAIGLGKMFGFTFIENFRLPYTATSIQDFWRKWHISLSSWFKEYVYIPLGGNRRGTARTYVNLWTVFLLTGIWHGAGWTFIFWGIYHGFFNVLERCFLGKWLKQEKFRPLAHIYAVFVVLIGWIFFRADTIGQAFSFIRYMFVPHSAVVLMERYMNRKLWMFLAAALLACGPVQWFWMKWKGRVLAQDGSVTVTSWIGYMAILWFSILLLVNNTYNPFIYFRF